ncbi:MAG: type secretion system rane protein PorP/SprF [Adhaeribacter sp.]|nr:type secretion system rane protein PorP/SprF [Adhaeribacter sp.]
MRLTFIQILCLFSWLPFTGIAQDLHFTQQYANRVHLNPAYAGLHADYNGTVSYRNQWPKLPGAFVTNQFSGYYRLRNQHSSVGLVVSNDKAGEGGLAKFQVGGQYAYQSILSEKLAFSLGMQLSYGSQRLDYSRLTFGDQLNDDGTTNLNSQELNFYDPVRYASVSTGAVVYDNNFWVSLAGHHLNRPVIGFNDASAYLPGKIIFNGGYKFALKTYYYLNKPYEWSITPSLTYTQQGPFKKSDIALYTTYTPFTFGLLYRGLPFLSNYAYDQSVSLLAGIVVDSWRIGYSYDIPLSPFGTHNGGAHEISLSFEKIDYNKIFKKRVSGKNYKRIALPSI